MADGMDRRALIGAGTLAATALAASAVKAQTPVAALPGKAQREAQEAQDGVGGLALFVREGRQGEVRAERQGVAVDQHQGVGGGGSHTRHSTGNVMPSGRALQGNAAAAVRHRQRLVDG